MTIRALVELAGFAALIIGLWQVDHRLALIVGGLIVAGSSVIGAVLQRPNQRRYK